jgi:metal-dependent hydrolase (beta-lactamase superfamily II)
MSPSSYESGIGRRDMLCSGGSAIFSSLIAALTIKGLVDLDVDHIVPMHCTGEPFYEILKAELPKKVIRSYTDTKLVFGA